jgi:hypothetical protein
MAREEAGPVGPASFARFVRSYLWIWTLPPEMTCWPES